MREDIFRKTTAELLSLAGVRINGDNPYDIKVYNDKLYRRILAQGALGLGESYMDGWWDCEQLDEFICRLLVYRIESKVVKNWKLLFESLPPRILNRQSKRKAFRIAEKHYNLECELFKNMLDKRMVYSCAYWKDAQTLDEAQEHKLDLVCRKLALQPGMSVLDIGCGWGSFVKHAAEKYGVQATGITISGEQVEYGKTVCRGLPVEIRLQDYRDVEGTFDRIVSLGMIEHVGYKNYRKYMKVAHRTLKDDGLFLLQTIGSNRSVVHADDWVDKYIFPNGMLPSIKQIGSAFEGMFVMEDWHNLSVHYDKTLMAWYGNFENSWDHLKFYFDERFCRMWKYYLLSFAGAFRARTNQVWQIVLSKKGVAGGYHSIR